MVRRRQAEEFLTLPKEYDLNKEEIQVADNYFTLLRNAGMPTTWFNDGVELGGGQSFTVGNEGDECNWRHIECALGLLLFRSVLTPPSPSGTDQFAYAACIGDRPAVLTTNIHYFQNLVRH